MAAPSLPVADCRYGAPLGRASAINPPAAKVYLRRVRLDAGGYDAGGAYWGHGLPLWYASDAAPDGLDLFFRAKDRDAAKRSVLMLAPGARFFR